MPSSLHSGLLHNFVRVAKMLTIHSGAKFVLPKEALPDAADAVEGQIALDADGVVNVFTGGVWVVVGSQA